MSKSKINPKLILNDMDDIFKYLKQYEEGKINIKELSKISKRIKNSLKKNTKDLDLEK